MAEAVITLSARDDTKGAFDSVRRSMDGLAASTGVLRNTLGGLGAGLGIGAVAKFLFDSVRAAEAAERSMRSLEQTVRSTGHAAGLTGKELESLSQSLAKTTLFDDDDIREGVVALLRFRTISRDVFRDATAAALDFASATGRDVVGASQAIGRALQDPVGGAKALREVGIKLTDSQVELANSLLEAGERAKAQRIILDELAKSVGGSAQAQNTGLTGATRSASKAWDDFLKTTGRQMNTSEITGTIDGITAAIEKLDSATKVLASSGNLTKFLGAPGGAVAGVAQRLALGDQGKRGTAAGIIPGGGLDAGFQAEMGRVESMLDAASEREAVRLKKRTENMKKAAEAQKKLEAEFLRERIRTSEEIGRQMGARVAEDAAVASVTNMLEIEVQNKRIEESAKKAAQAQAELAAILGDTKSGRIAEVERRQLLLNEALKAGTITAKQFNEAFDVITTEYDAAVGRGVDGIRNLADSGSKDIERLTQAFEGFGRRASDTFAEFVVTGKASFNDLVQSIIKDLISMAAYKAVIGPIFGSLGGFFGGKGGKGFFAGSAQGNVFGPGGLVPFANGGLVTQPTIFPFANGIGLMGEKGTEAIMPLRRGADGRLGVEASGGGSPTIVQHNTFQAGVDPTQIMPLLQANNAQLLAQLQRNRARGMA